VASPRSQTIRSSLHPVYLCPSVQEAVQRLSAILEGRPAYLCTERRLARLLSPVVNALGEGVPGMRGVAFSGGERNKTRETKARLEDALLSKGAGRDAVLLALGGGVVTDLVGFTAGTYLRGIPWVALPTTVVGMVDAALGGKTGVNTERGKNLVGLFHPPLAVIGVLSVLESLPPKEFRAGLAECLKHGLSLDASFLRWLRRRSPEALRRDPPSLLRLLLRSAALKCAVVDEDPKEETGRRNVLNAGHTVGHALERLSGFDLGHGEAVASGLVWEAAAAAMQGFLRREESLLIRREALRLGFRPHWRRWNPKEVFDAARADKKNRRGEVRYVPLGGLGKVALPPPHTAALDLATLAKALSLVEEG
jgi:3-dehydroquinate synthase